MWKGLLRTSDSFVDTVMRLALAAVFFPHGAQKALGWFGGYGLSGTMGFFTEKMGIPPILAALAIAAEFLGPIALFFGIFTRIAALGIFAVMGTAVALAHWKVGFFMNWAGKYPAGTEGFEFHILALALAFAVTVRGAGACSVDRSWAGGR
ncbi:MAG: DoxX family protein [Deltaproteobacteria bacterium]